jgi:hypothetical protein
MERSTGSIFLFVFNSREQLDPPLEKAGGQSSSSLLNTSGSIAGEDILPRILAAYLVVYMSTNLPFSSPKINKSKTKEYTK